MTGHETPDAVPLPTGHRIPLELLYYLPLHYASNTFAWEDSPLGQWTLVCREWARVLRPIKFSHIEIDSHKKARDFVALVNTTSLPTELRIGPCVQNLYLYQDISTWSWVHTILCCNTKELLPNLGGNIDIQLVDRDAVSNAHGALLPNTIHHHLPRTLPPASVGSLGLDDFSGSSTLKSLMRLCSSVRTSYPVNLSCKLQSDSFKDIAPGYIPGYRLHSPLAGYPNIDLRPLHDNSLPAIWPLVWLVRRNQTRSPPPTTSQLNPGPNLLSLSDEDALRLARLIAHVIDDCQCFMCTTPDSPPSTDATKQFRCYYSTEHTDPHHILQFASSAHKLELTFSPQHHLTHIAIDLTHQRPLRCSSGAEGLVFMDSRRHNLDVDFGGLDEALSAFLPRCKIGICVAVPGLAADEERVVWEAARDEVVEFVKAKMTVVDATGRLEVVVDTRDVPQDEDEDLSKED